MTADAKHKLGFGIIGCGSISKWHANAVAALEDGYLVGVTDYDAARAVSLAREYQCKAYACVEDLLKSNEIDIVCICTPSGLHAEHAVMAANAGKHFIVEKPVAITKEQITRILAACEKNAVKGCVISQFRFSPAVQAVKKAIEDGSLGKILVADLSMKYHRSPAYYQSSPWRGTRAMDGGGALMNQGIHGIDLLQYLVGSVRAVSGICKTLVHEIEVEDTASLTVEYENGAIGSITGTTSLSHGYPRRIEINGTKGTVVLTEDSITLWEVNGTPPPLPPKQDADTASHNDPSRVSMCNHEKQLKDMVAAIRQNRRPLVDLYEGKKAVEIILAAYESGRTGKRVILKDFSSCKI